MDEENESGLTTSVAIIDALTGEPQEPTYRKIRLGEFGKYTFDIVNEDVMVTWADTRTPQEVTAFIEKSIYDFFDEAEEEDILLTLCYMGRGWDARMEFAKEGLYKLREKSLWDHIRPPLEGLEILSTVMMSPSVRVSASATNEYNDETCTIQINPELVSECPQVLEHLAQYVGEEGFADYLLETIKKAEKIIDEG